MSRTKPIRVHLVTGGFPPGTSAGHDMDYARNRLLGLLADNSQAVVTTANDFADLARWLPESRLMVTYVAGPFPDDEQDAMLGEWLERGGRWLALHGTSGGKAAPVGTDRRVRRMVKGNYHATLGSFFLNHPPVRRFRVDVANHPLTRGVPSSFETSDELYLIELQQPERSQVLLTTKLAKDPSPPGFGFAYDRDTSLLTDGRTRALGYVREQGRGAVAYFALGHCHSPLNNVQPFVDSSVEASGATPLTFRGSWENAAFETLLRNALQWGTSPAS
ncbi:MAG TPA: ThuA domain-containing protein [Candidatus Binataceae bacterium]|nr:ThuA domain-containing protein [Candidatus Binataceae bacterium]